ncbi:hypothetical protein L484_020300 [Morus notabilis]|uniref:Uncharacterized protein n=2 Tax=Morus notabilis TaxID=981085 RepID=W9QH69_9ROSA|nr:hypothetical protein L484_020300 [Morus notabilis]
MFLNNITRRRLASLLRPWLLSEPDLELKLGLINSEAIATNLRFDTSILNGLVDDQGGLCFSDVTIERLIMRFSNWSVPAISFEVHGFHVTLSVRNSKEESSLRQTRKGREAFAEGVKKKLSQIDPEGSLLHSALERISATTPSRNKFKTAFLNLILKHCQLQIHNLNVQVKLPMLNDSCACILHLKELNAEAKYLNFGCLLRGLVSAVFLPVKESSYIISGVGFEIGFKMVEQVKPVLLSTNLYTCIKLNDFQLIHFDLRVPELSISFSPADLLMYLAFGEISPKESQCARNGRQLWRLAASGVGQVISAPRLKFHNLVVIVGLWLRYANAYEYILQLVGYSADDLLKRSTTKMVQNNMFLSSVKKQWKVISDIEKELPVESIAQARRIARYRAALNVQSVFSKESYVNTHVKFFWKIFPPLGVIWKLILNLFHFIVRLLFFWRKAKAPTGEYLEVVSDDPFQHFGFSLNAGRILVNISHMDEIQLSEIEKLESSIGIPFSDFISFSLSINALLLNYREDICEQSLVVSCGQFKVKSSSLMETPLRQDDSKIFPSHAKGQWEESNNHLESILWFEPAQTFPLSETSKKSIADNAQGDCDSFLENCLGEMWSNWAKGCVQFEKSDIQYSENPFLLLEMTSLLTYPGLKNSYSGFWKCFFTLGKLHLGLGCSSIISISLLIRQLQNVLCRTRDIERSKVLSHCPGTAENPPETSWDSRYKCYANSLRLTLLKMLPEKHIQFGVFITGPCIRLSLEKECSGGSKDKSRMTSHGCFPLAFDIHDIEVAIWPTSTSDYASYVEHHSSDDAEPECIRLEQPQIIDIPKSDNANYISERWILLGTYLQLNGFTAYLGDPTEKQRSQLLVLQPMTVQLSSTR